MPSGSLPPAATHFQIPRKPATRIQVPLLQRRQEQFAPSKRKKVIGSNEEVVGRLGISAETVALIVENQSKNDKKIDPGRVIKHVGFDELSLKNRHKLYVTLMTDLTDPDSPKVLAVARGKDTSEKKHAEVQGQVIENPAEAVPLADVGVPPRPEGPASLRGRRR